MASIASVLLSMFGLFITDLIIQYAVILLSEKKDE
jgi:hypothetical protein